MDESEIDFMDDLFNIENYFSTRKLLRLFAPELDQNKIDIAYPVDYAERIRQIYPDFDKGYMVYNYNDKKFGEMLNINNLIAEKIFSFFQDAVRNYIKRNV